MLASVFALTRADFWLFVFVASTLWLVTRIHVAPTVSNIQNVVTILNTKGGIILTLGAMSIFFFIITIWMFFIILQDLKAKTLTVDNAVALMAIQFCMNSAFSVCLGAMLKTMTGDPPQPTGGSSSVTITKKVDDAIPVEPTQEVKPAS